MKRIAVLIHSIYVEYSLNILEGICNFYKDKDVQLFVSQVGIPHARDGIFDYHYWSSVPLFFTEQIDGIIIITGSFTSAISMDSFSKILKGYGSKPIISIGVPLNIENSFSTTTDCRQSYKDIIGHLKEKHGCKKIAYMSANLTQSQESFERYKAYKSALRYNGLSYNENIVFHGMFTRISAKNALMEKYSTKESVDFDAIVAANDLMAQGCQEYLQSLGVKIPEDVKIIGFDGTSHCKTSRPSISTIDQQIVEHGSFAASLMLKKLNGKKIKEVSKLSTKPIYRQSCGCIPLTEVEEIAKDNDGNIIDDKSKDNVISSSEYNSQLSLFTGTFDYVNQNITLRRFSYKIKYMMEEAKIDSLFVYLYDEPYIMESGEDYNLPEKINFIFSQDNRTKKMEFMPGIAINPHKQFFLENYFSLTPGFYYVTPIFDEDKNYGYTISQFNTKNLALYTTYIRLINHGIAQSFNFANTIVENQELSERFNLLQNDNKELTRQSRTDELTKLLNRRGFMELGQRAIDICVEMDGTGLVFFADLDNLKKINDTYGHEMGDLAIKYIAEIFGKSFRSSDIVARLSGDEFAAVAVGLSHDRFVLFHDKINKLCEAVTVEKNLPFKLSCSIGCVEFSAKNSSLTHLLRVADQRLYVEKRRFHSGEIR